MNDFRVRSETSGEMNPPNVPYSPSLATSITERGASSEVCADALGDVSAEQYGARREAALRGLYDERGSLLTKKRLGTLSSHETAYLHDLEREIDKLETGDGDLRGGELWARIDELASRVVAAHDRAG